MAGHIGTGMIDPMDTGALVRLARLRAGLTQAELARRAATSQPAVARYESGVASPSVATLERLLRAAGERLELGSSPARPTNLAGPLSVRLRSRRTEVLDAARRAGARDVRVFGSVARGDEGPTSDIDLLVDYDPSAGLAPIIELADDLSRLLDAKVEVSPVAILKPSVRRTALAEAIAL